jgi:hypothetical protein
MPQDDRLPLCRRPHLAAAETLSARPLRVTFPDCPGIAVLNLADLPVMLAFITAVAGFGADMI